MIMINHGKKLLSLILVILMAISMVPVTALADATASVTMVSSAEGSLNPGDTFTVSANISGNPGFSAADFYFSVGEGVEITAISNADSLMNSGMFMAGKNLDMLTYVATGDCITADGTMFTLTCKVKDDAAAGTYEVNVDSTNSKHNFTGEDENWNTYTINASFTAATVTVETEPATVAVTGVTLDEEALEFTLGSEPLSETLTATVLPEDAENKAVEWKSSDAAVATVENGVVTAVGEGTATITVTTEDGNFTAECAVKVNPVPKTMNGDHADMNVSSNTVTAGETVLVNISVENDQDAASVYNSYEFVVDYDDAYLAYNGFTCADDNCAVTEKDGKLIINGYGEIKPVSEDAFVTLNFVASNSGEADVEAKVYLEKAYRDTSAMAIQRDIDQIEVETTEKSITIQPSKVEYEVTFNETVKVNGEGTQSVKTEAGKTVTFDIIPQTGKDVQVEGATLVEGNTYKVVVTDNTQVTITYTDKTFGVTIGGAGKEDVTGEATATYGKEYSFTVNMDDDYNYTVSATVGGQNVEMTIDGSKYTIAGAAVTGEIEITVTKDKKQSGGPTEEYVDIHTNTNGATENVPVTEIVKGDEHIYEIPETHKVYKVTIGGEPVNVTYDSDGNLHLPAGTTSGDIVIYLGEIYDHSAQLADGTSAADAVVLAEEKPSYGTDYNFTVKAGYKLDNVVIGEAAAAAEGEEPVYELVSTDEAGNSTYKVAGTNILGDITVIVHKIVYAETVDVYPYVKVGGTEDGATVIQLVVATAGADVAEGEILQYNGQNMFWSSKYNGYAYLVLVGENEELLTKEAAAALIGAAKATAVSIEYDGNVNMSETGNVDVNDAQLVYDLYNARYGNFTQVTMEKMLRADMNANADKAEATYGLTVSDVAAVMAFVNAK